MSVSGFLLIGLACLILAPSYAVPAKNTSIAAEYYFSTLEYKQSLKLWKEVLSKQPKNVSALIRISELKLLFEGRIASRDTILQFLRRHGKELTPKTKRRIVEELNRLQTMFLTDNGQGIYLRAIPKLASRDFEGALSLLDQARAIEKGNLRVLKEKAKCEKALRSYEAYYGTLRAAYAGNPYDSHVLGQLAEAHVYFNHPEKALEIFGLHKFRASTTRQQVAYGIALFFEGQWKEARFVFQRLFERDKHIRVPPIVLYAMGEILAKRLDTRGAAVGYLRRFISATGRKESALIDGWDPYRTDQKIDSAKNLLKILQNQRLG